MQENIYTYKHRFLNFMGAAQEAWYEGDIWKNKDLGKS